MKSYNSLRRHGSWFEQLEGRLLMSAITPSISAAPIVHAAAAGAPAQAVAIAASKSGQQVTAYVIQGDGSPAMAQIYDAGGQPVGDPIQVSDGAAQGVAVACDAAGDFVVAWAETAGDQTLIMARQFDATGAPLADAFQVDTGEGRSNSPAVGMDDAGDFVVAWRNWTPGAKEVTLLQGTPGEITQSLDENNHIVNDVTPGTVEQDVESFDDAGVLVQLFDADGNAVGGAFRADTATTAITDITCGPAVAMDSAGRFTIAWAVETSKVYTTTTPAVVETYEDVWYDDNDNEHVVQLKDTVTSYKTQSMEPASVAVTVQAFDATGAPAGRANVLGLTPQGRSTKLIRSAAVSALDAAADGGGNVAVVWQIDKQNTPIIVDDTGAWEQDPVPMGSAAYLQVFGPTGKAVMGKATAFTAPAGAIIVTSQVAMSPSGIVSVMAEIETNDSDTLQLRQFAAAGKKAGAVKTMDLDGVPFFDLAATADGSLDYAAPDLSQGGIVTSLLASPKPNLTTTLGNIKIKGIAFDQATLPRGGTLNVPLGVANVANTLSDAIGTASVEVFLSASGVLDDSAIPLMLPPVQQLVNLALKPGKLLRLTLKPTIPADLPDGPFFLIARINDNLGVAESTLLDNIAASPASSAS